MLNRASTPSSWGRLLVGLMVHYGPILGDNTPFVGASHKLYLYKQDSGKSFYNPHDYTMTIFNGTLPN